MKKLFTFIGIMLIGLGLKAATRINGKDYDTLWNPFGGHLQYSTAIDSNTITGCGGITVTTTTAGVNINGSGAGGGGSSSLAVSKSGVLVSSPTAVINFIGSNVAVALTGGATAQVTISGTSPGGSNTNVQFSSNSTFGGNNGFQYDSSVSSVTLGGQFGLTTGSNNILLQNVGGDPNIIIDNASGTPGEHIKFRSFGTTTANLDAGSGTFSISNSTGNSLTPVSLLQFQTTKTTFLNAASQSVLSLDYIGNSTFSIPVAISTLTISKQLIDSSLSAGTSGYVYTSRGASSGPQWLPGASGGGGTPAGSNTQLQFNNSGAFGASSNLIWDGTFLTTYATTPNSQMNIGSGPDGSDFGGIWMGAAPSSVNYAFLASASDPFNGNIADVFFNAPGTTGKVLFRQNNNSYMAIAGARIMMGDSFINDTSWNDTNAVLTVGSYQSAAVKPLTVKGAASQTANLQEWQTSAALPIVSISAYGHINSTGTAPILSSCGTSPGIIGDDYQGTITVGGGVVTACTMTFAHTYNVTPTCQISDNSTAITGDISALSSTAATFSFSSSLGGGLIYYHCGCSGLSCQ